MESAQDRVRGKYSDLESSLDFRTTISHVERYSGKTRTQKDESSCAQTIHAQTDDSFHGLFFLSFTEKEEEDGEGKKKERI